MDANVGAYRIAGRTFMRSPYDLSWTENRRRSAVIVTVEPVQSDGKVSVEVFRNQL